MAVDDYNRAEKLGLFCPQCGCPENTVIWVRHKKLTIGDEEICKTIRRRECANCGVRYHTTERVGS